MLLWTWRKFKSLHRNALNGENLVIPTSLAVQPSQAPIRALQQPPESAAHLFFMALFDRVILGCLDSRVVRIDSGKKAGVTAKNMLELGVKQAGDLLTLVTASISC